MYLDEKHLPSPVQLEPWRQVLLDAADYIETHGWCQTEIGAAGKSVCAVGAMWMAFQGKIPARGDKNWGFNRTIDSVYDAFSKYLGVGYIASWNDAPNRTAAEVTAAMRECARAL